MYILHSKQPSDNNLSSQAQLQTHRMGMAPFSSTSVMMNIQTSSSSPLMFLFHYGGIAQRLDRARLILRYIPGSFPLQVGQLWSKLGLRRLIPPVSSPHTPESCSTAGGLNITVYCQSPTDTCSYNPVFSFCSYSLSCFYFLAICCLGGI